MNAAYSGNMLGTHTKNGLLYESTIIAAGAIGNDQPLDMLNIYAYDYR